MLDSSGRARIDRLVQPKPRHGTREAPMPTPADPPLDAHPVLACILVVEDEPVIRELMAILLEEEGYTVRQACDGLEALETLEQHPVDLVLSDVKMPRLDGASLAHQLRAQEHPLPVILMSAV